MRFLGERVATVVLLLLAMTATVTLVGHATGLRGVMAGLAFWPLVPYLLLFIVTGRPATRVAAVAALAATAVVASLGVGTYYLAFVRAPYPPSPLVFVLVPLGQLVVAALILGGVLALARRTRGR